MTRVVVAFVALSLGCQRQPPPDARIGYLTDRHQVTERRAGPPPALPEPRAARGEEPDEAQLAEGRQLYGQYNCSGCHAAGGGAIGPALIDDEWIYGSSVENIFYTIIEGRPQGMPAYRGRIPDGHVRSLAMYVHSLSASDEAASDDRAAADDAAPTAAPSSVERGREVFLQGPCAICHTIRGTQALATVGPDLTHLASRIRIAGGLLPNTRGNLAGWILNPQNLKPGTKMPPTLLHAEELHALLDYLGSLK